VYIPDIAELLDYMKNKPQPAQTKGCRSFFKFKPTRDEKLIVFFKRITPDNPKPKWVRVGKVTDPYEFMQLAQGHLEMQDDNTWAEPEKWSVDI
jgi:hypothetical protein